ncbi:DUF202 domain-containing protein [Novipirellula galeiformis]|uniref:DUF202 domain-containing protein n=1 Tax=Novipirellula galeiformis TaxID=2528004 RepID=UPI0018CD77A4|nr:DUF202 domain-containing protein [Novipirellula galeiformis]
MDKQTSSEDLNLIRTDLANERTLLAYGRTALMVAGTGVSVLKFFSEMLYYQIIGWSLIAIGLIIGVIGAERFVRLSRRLH